MKVIALFFLVIFSFSNIHAGGILKHGTQITLMLTSDIDSQSKDQPIFVVYQDVKDADGKVLIAAQTPVAIESTIKKRQGVGKPGAIEVRFISTTSSDGQIIILDGIKRVEGEDKNGKVLGISLGVGLLLFSPMLAYLAKKGGSAEMVSGLQVPTVFIVGEYTIK